VGSVTINGDGTYALPTTVLATQVGTYTWHANYLGDSLNNGAIDDGSNESLTTIKASPTISTNASETAGGVVGTAVLSDSVTVTGGYNPTGTVTFTLTQPDNSSISVGSVTINGDGTYALPTTVLATQVGTYTWHANYLGDSLNNGAIDDGSNESLTTIKASPTIITTSNPTGSVTQTNMTMTVTDSAVVSAGYNETGSLVFTLTGPGGFSYTQTDTLAGNSTYTATTSLPAGAALGTYTWTVTFAGDANNNSAADQGGAAEQFTLQGAIVGRGNAATIGFWANKNGKALLGTYTTSDIGNWLATTYPNLFGNLSGATGPQVYTYFVKLKSASGLTNSTMTDALAVAMSEWVTTSGLGWNTSSTGPTHYGFIQGPGGVGLGSLYFNVTNNGASFGVANNTLLTVDQILAYYNSHTVRTGGSSTALPTWVVYGGNTSLLNGANVVLDGINQTGDIV
jgi:hypothetical protein